jgi:hypothetical protein
MDELVDAWKRGERGHIVVDRGDPRALERSGKGREIKQIEARRWGTRSSLTPKVVALRLRRGCSQILWKIHRYGSIGPTAWSGSTS